jgi:menaquinone-dependent protoporphyrinogen oxidase
LEQKRVGLFICGTDPENHEKAFTMNYPAELLDCAVVKTWLGGRILFADQKGITRFVLKKMLKGDTDVHAEQPEALKAFVTSVEAI